MFPILIAFRALMHEPCSETVPHCAREDDGVAEGFDNEDPERHPKGHRMKSPQRDAIVNRACEQEGIDRNQRQRTQAAQERRMPRWARGAGIRAAATPSA